MSQLRPPHGQIVLVELMPTSADSSPKPVAPRCIPSAVTVPEGLGEAYPIYYILDENSVNAGYYIAGFFCATPFAREYLYGIPSIRGSDIEGLPKPCPIGPEQLYTGFTIPNINHRLQRPDMKGANPEWTKLVDDAYTKLYPVAPELVEVDVTLAIQNYACPQIQILFDPQDQDVQGR